MLMKRIEVVATMDAESGLWEIEIPEFDATTQAETLAEVDKEASDFVALTSGMDPSEFMIVIRPLF